jgi:hypothetical protein
MTRPFPRYRQLLAICGFGIALCQPLFAQSPWPGQNGNSVGYAAYGDGVLGTTSCGTLTNGTSTSYKLYSKCTVSSGAVNINYAIFSQVDFTTDTAVSGSNLVFIGCRFQSNSTEYYNVMPTGSNLAFLYSSVTPLASFYTSPPGLTWPSAGAGKNTTVQTTGTNAINGNDGYEYGFNITAGGPVTIDHSDIWGFGNAIVFYSTSTQMTVTNNWIHDAANASPQSYHTDGPGYLNGSDGPSNITIQGNTIASLGNTNGIAFQAATSGYNNMQIFGNYLSGFGYTIAAGQPGNTSFSNSLIVNNVWGTDVEPVWNPLYDNGWSGNSSVWACNTLHFLSGTAWTDGDGWTPTSSIDGKYFVPTSGISSSTDWNGNTVCGLPSPSSLDFQTQSLATTSAAQTVTFKNAGTGVLNISSIVLQTGTQFAISANKCGSTLSSGASCTVAVTFTPTSQGFLSDNLRIADNSLAPSSPHSVPLIGVGVGTGVVVNPPTGLTASVQ